MVQEIQKIQHQYKEKEDELNHRLDEAYSIVENYKSSEVNLRLEIELLKKDNADCKNEVTRLDGINKIIQQESKDLLK